MIVTNQFVFLHLHKSGGSFVNRLLIESLPDARQIGYHLAYNRLPKIFNRLPVLGTVRNPWDYYVSWYHFQLQMKQPNYLFDIMSRQGTLSFESTIENLLNLFNDDKKLSAVITAAPEKFSTKDLNLTKDCYEQYRGPNMGFYSFLYRRLYDGTPEVHLIKMETLRGELCKFLMDLGFPSSHPIFDRLSSMVNANKSKHQDYSLYYSETLKQHVLEQDSHIIKAHEYNYEQQPKG